MLKVAVKIRRTELRLLTVIQTSGQLSVYHSLISKVTEQIVKMYHLMQQPYEESVSSPGVMIAV